MKLKTHTLGCKVNQYETQYVREGLASIGWADAAEGEAADLCVVNTCTVTAEGDSKSRQVIRRFARENPSAKIVVMGCYATRAPDEVRALPGVTEVVTDKRELPDLLGRFGVTDVPLGVSGLGSRSRAYVKVQDGCLLRCSFCVIPHVRPNLASRPMDEVVQEVRRLTENGYREVVLTGIHLGHYGVDWNRQRPRDKESWVRLSHLVRRLAELPAGPSGDWRVRLSSIEATEVTRELIDVMADHPDRVCPHLHISMQSGSDSVLRRMRRRWGSQRFVDRCGLLRERLDRPAITTDVIVGFPGETEAEFEETLATCRAAGFSKIHGFPFSRRRGTPAWDMPDQVDKQVKKERIHRLAEVEAELRDAYYESLVGSPLRVLVESRLADGRVAGSSCRYAPVELAVVGGEAGRFVDATPVRVAAGRLIA
ncbi:tRNA (N(6)-L-threonylcarbamoyladenosine(37)-C(2))-methylthiotransferase MtaB [Botrimarina sp.]|uniref:tRNA (N(6)-L-threonylcarbamoyladenosine(37)-C(2))- methylthiotransferase MtaB n=1 Tax=Botrimarina sp. TaxID=2795802 RepID=UPI0032EF8F6B